MKSNNTNTTALLNMSQLALSQALDELAEARKTLAWAKDKLTEAQLDNRKLCNLLLRFSESPDPDEYERLLEKLDKPCGFTECALTKQAASAIRSLAAKNSYLLAENRRLQYAHDPR